MVKSVGGGTENSNWDHLFGDGDGGMSVVVVDAWRIASFSRGRASPNLHTKTRETPEKPVNALLTMV